MTTSPNNTAFEWELGDKAAVDQAIASAAHVTSIDLVNNRLMPNAMEPRAAIGEYERGTDGFTLYTTSQNPHVARLVISAFVGVAPEHKLRVVAPDVGGGFGSKIFIYAEECVCLLASRTVGRPVKWTAERTESFQCDAHGRDHVTQAQLAMDADGNFTALKVHTIANVGRLSLDLRLLRSDLSVRHLLAGQYKTPAIYCEVDAVYTNTAPGRCLSRCRSAGGHLSGRDPRGDRGAGDGARSGELRRKNFIPPDGFPIRRRSP